MALELLTREQTTDDVPLEIKRQLIAQDVQMWRNTIFQATARHRTYKRIGMEEDAAKQIEVIRQCEAALIDIDEQLKELE